MMYWMCSFLLLVVPTIAFAPLAPRYSPSALGMVAIDTSEIKNGLTIELDGEPYKVLSFSIMKQARGAAKTTIKFKNLMRGTTIENTYRSGEKFETALIERKQAQFTYREGVRSRFTRLSRKTPSDSISRYFKWKTSTERFSRLQSARKMPLSHIALNFFCLLASTSPC